MMKVYRFMHWFYSLEQEKHREGEMSDFAQPPEFQNAAAKARIVADKYDEADFQKRLSDDEIAV